MSGKEIEMSEMSVLEKYTNKWAKRLEEKLIENARLLALLENPWPKPTAPQKKGGWRINCRFLEQIADDCELSPDGKPSLECVENVLMAAVARLNKRREK